MNKIITPECSTYQLNNNCTVKIWNDKTFSIVLTEDTVDLKPNEVLDLYRIVSSYKAIYEQWED